MPDKEIKIKVTTETDIANLDELDKKMDDIQSKSNIKVEGDASDLDDEIEEISQALSAARDRVEELEDALDDAHLNGDDIEADIIADELAEARDEAESLQEALDNLESSTLSPEVDDSSIGEAKDTTEELNEGLDEIDNKTVSPEVDDSSISQTKDSVDDLNNNLDLLDSAALMGISTELSSMGAGAENAAQQMNTAAIAVGQLSTQTGVAESSMIGLINNISNATFPQSEAMAYVNVLNQMRVSANKLGDSATNMDKINDATGIGYEKVIRLTQGLQSMGITADALPNSFNAIAYAQSNVVGGADTLTTALKTQASTFNEYGLNVDQVVLMMGKLSEKGVSQQRIGRELGSVIKDCNGDLSAMEEKLGLSAGALSNASSETGKYTGQLQKLANEEAEHKSWLDLLGAAWEDLSLSMTPVLAPLASFMGLLGQAGSWAVGINGLVKLYQTISSLSIIQTVKGYLSSFKSTLVAVGSTAKSAALHIGTVAKEILISGYNALKSAAMWVVQKAQMLASTIATWAQTAAQWALNIAMDANPIGILIIAITALVVALGYLYFNNEQVRSAIDGLGQTLTWVGGIIRDSVGAAIQWLSDQFNGFTQQLGLNTGNWTQAILGFILFLPTLPLRVGAELANTIARALGFKGNFVQTLWSTATDAVSKFASAIQGIVTAVQNCLDWAYQIFMSHPIVQAAVWLGKAIANGFSALGLGQNSPGKIVKAMKAELDWTQEAIEKSTLPSASAGLGSSIAGRFNPELNDISFGNGGHITNNYINISDIVVDDDKRMDKIAEEIAKRIHWENTTAGRTV